MFVCSCSLFVVCCCSCCCLLFVAFSYIVHGVCCPSFVDYRVLFVVCVCLSCFVAVVVVC